jgi:hypothetical protein
MRERGRLMSIALVTSGLALLAWLLYDATGAHRALRLDSVMDEASVVVGGLAAGVALVATGILYWRRSRGRTSLTNAL